MNIMTSCPLCGKRSLQVIENQMSQCLNCGYSTAEKLKGTKETNQEFKKMSDDMKKMSVENNGQLWVPSVVNLPDGIINPILTDDTILWAFSPAIEIPEHEQKHYPDDNGGFYKLRYDNEQTTLFKTFFEAIEHLSKNYNENKKSNIKLPKLKKIDGTEKTTL
mgnify:CR=1 FL=1